MPSKFLNISTDTTLGGSSASDSTVSSQKAIKAYVDGKQTLSGLTDVTISNPTAGQNLTYDATNQVWKNTSTSATVAWGGITGIMSDQTDLKNALDAKYDASNPNGYTSNVGTVTSVNNVSPVNGNVTISIPSEVTESTVSGWGFTKNTGTVTSVNSVSPVNGNVTLSIPAAQVNSDWNAVSGVTQILNKPNLATVATSGSYNDLSNKPTIPAVNNATLTLTQGGTTKGIFTANASSNVTIDLDSGGGSVDVDNKSITTNSSDEIQTVGVINSRDSSTAVKTWTGTKAQYDAIVTKDANTLYNITDDTDVTLTILEALYPVGSVYITTANTCPLSTLISGSTWELVSSGIVKSGEVPVKGNGMTLGLTNGTDNCGAYNLTNYALAMSTGNIGTEVGTSTSGTLIRDGKTVGVVTDPTKSGIIADTSSLTLSVNIFERTA